MRGPSKRLGRRGSGLAMLALMGATAASADPGYVIHNAKIVTVDDKFSIVEAAAVKDGRFVAVGSKADVLRRAGADARLIDLGGKTVLPGFNDTHNHQLNYGKRFANAIDLTDIHSIADIQRQIAERVKTAKPGEWIIGSRGWWEYDLTDGRLPDRYDLDKVAPNNPVDIPGPHYVIVNSLAMKLAGIGKDTPDPQGGEIRKDPRTGEPTGLLFDEARGVVRRVQPTATPQEEVAGVLRMMADNNANGITSIGEPSGSVRDMQTYRDLYDQGKLTTRVDFAFNVNPIQPLEKSEAEIAALGKPGHEFGDGMFRADQLGEVQLDGAELTAFLREPYPDRPDYSGLQKVPTDHYKAFAALAARYGYRLRPHAVGDAAIDEALEAFEYANSKTDITQRRWMIDHAFLLLPDHYPRVKALGVIINAQYMLNAQLGALILKAWHRPLADKMMNYKDWLDAGLMFTNGADGPVSYHPWPLYQIYGAVTRKTMWGGVLGPDQGITREQAIRAVTSWSAYTSFEEKVKGSIEPGKYADFVVLSDDVLTVPAEKIKDIKVLATVLGGRPVFGSLASGDVVRTALAEQDSQ